MWDKHKRYVESRWVKSVMVEWLLLQGDDMVQLDKLPIGYMVHGVNMVLYNDECIEMITDFNYEQKFLFLQVVSNSLTFRFLFNNLLKDFLSEGSTIRLGS